MSAWLVVIAAVATGAAPATEDIIVAVRDIAAGTVVTFDMIKQQKVSKSVVTKAFVAPSEASYVVNQRTSLPLLAGDPVLWSFFDEPKDRTALNACAKVMPPKVDDARAQVAKARAVVLKK
ncbi:MAG: hypothetical protein JNK82_38605 [Myxococcaceae bacterium]|nr:hypothetical protein [Myxococcaceae bacterium]